MMTRNENVKNRKKRTKQKQNVHRYQLIKIYSNKEFDEKNCLICKKKENIQLK